MYGQASTIALEFPPIETALTEPNGLLASGGNLEPQTLLDAYCRGIFPWANANEPLLWWSPDPRATIAPHKVHIAKSLRKALGRCGYTLSVNRAFDEVIHACASARKTSAETWISESMIDAYTQLHTMKHAHSIEVWQQEQLIGGLYGVAVGDIFCGESMFHRKTDTSKMAFVALCRLLQKARWRLIDCQIQNSHLQSLGVQTMPRETFKRFLPTASNALKLLSGTNPSSAMWQQLPWKDCAELAADLP
jgi:leucyl/phenylalanyl-tRNA--protein transferase